MTFRLKSSSFSSVAAAAAGDDAASTVANDDACYVRDRPAAETGAPWRWAWLQRQVR